MSGTIATFFFKIATSQLGVVVYLLFAVPYASIKKIESYIIEEQVSRS